MTALRYKKMTDGAQVPTRKHGTDGGADLHAAESLVLHAHERRAVGTGIAVEIPAGYLGYVVPRSGLAIKHGITIVNAPGLIDADFRGEIKAILLNTSDEDFTIEKGDRIAQLVIQKCELVDFEETDDLSDTARGASAFGSTGVK